MTPVPNSPPVPESVSPEPPQHNTRADWLRVLSCALKADLLALAGPVVADYRFEALRAPQVGLLMVRARIGNTGDRFNVGEASVVRCAVRFRAPDGTVTAGVGYTLGRDEQKANRIAEVDALLQWEPLQATLLASVIEPLRTRIASLALEEQRRTEASRVRFFTLQPELA